MLSFLPSLPGAKPRARAVAAKNAAPQVKIDHKDARLALAARLTQLYPGLSHEKYAQFYAYTVQILGNIALEEVLRIRKALYNTLKNYACLPPKIAEQLVKEAEREVSEPILRFCAGLSDHDLKAILSDHPHLKTSKLFANGRLGYAPIVAVNHNGQVPLSSDISAALLTTIVETSRDVIDWQRPVNARKSLPPSVARKLEDYVDKTVEDILMEHEELDYRSSSEITRVFRRRMNYALLQHESGDSTIEHLKRVLKDNMLDDDMIADALAMQDYPFVWAALAYKAKTTMQHVQTIFGMKAAKPIVALCWRAGISMRLAFHLQKDAGFVPAKDLIYPKEGSDYPMSADNIQWQLEFLGLKVV